MADKGNKERRKEIKNRTGKCSFCPAHDGENRGRRQKDDKKKNHRRKKS